MTEKTTDADVAFIKALAELLRENDLTELEVKREFGEDDSLNVRVSRAAPTAAAVDTWLRTKVAQTKAENNGVPIVFEAFQMHDQNDRQLPQVKLLGCVPELLAPPAVPTV